MLEAERLAAELGGCFDASGAGEPETSLRRSRGGSVAVVALPEALVADVFHGAWPRAALLHRAVLDARL